MTFSLQHPELLALSGLSRVSQDCRDNLSRLQQYILAGANVEGGSRGLEGRDIGVESRV